MAFGRYAFPAESIWQDCSLNKYPVSFLYCPECSYTAVPDNSYHYVYIMLYSSQTYFGAS